MTDASTDAAARVPLRGDGQPLPLGVAQPALLAGRGGRIAFAGWYGSLALLVAGAAVGPSSWTTGMLLNGIGALGMFLCGFLLFLWFIVNPSVQRLLRIGAAAVVLCIAVAALSTVGSVATTAAVERALPRLEPLVATMRAHPGVARMDSRGGGWASLNEHAGPATAPAFAAALAEAEITRERFDELRAVLRENDVFSVEAGDGYVALRLRGGVALLHAADGSPPPAPGAWILGAVRLGRTPLGGGWYRY